MTARSSDFFSGRFSSPPGLGLSWRQMGLPPIKRAVRMGATDFIAVVGCRCPDVFLTDLGVAPKVSIHGTQSI